MKSNLGSPDKVIRILIAVAVLVLYLTHVISGTLGIVLLVVGGVLALTAIINFCPIYYVLGLRTNKKE
jgi:hypothetical protein